MNRTNSNSNGHKISMVMKEIKIVGMGTITNTIPRIAKILIVDLMSMKDKIVKIKAVMFIKHKISKKILNQNNTKEEEDKEKCPNK